LLDKVANPQQRISIWRDYKSGRPSRKNVLQYIYSIEPINRTFDYYTPSTWPTPWEILDQGMFCVSGKAILLYHTLAQLEYIDTSKVRWLVAENKEIFHEGLVFFDGLCYYNILPNTSVNIENFDNYITVREIIRQEKLTKIHESYKERRH
jgi:hypothetical protein|tara:strand:+ start:203 stop:655 length:453 start_codon:yes stop_codon:yes gene_type:complete